MGICSSCKDINDRIVATHIVREEFAESYWSYNLSHTDPAYLAIRDGSDLQFMFKKGSHPFLNIQAPNREGYASRTDYSPSTNITFMSFTWADCSMPASYSDSWDWYYQVDCSNSSRFPGLQDKVGVTAVSCSSDLCVRNYASKIRNGGLEEQIISIS